MKRLLVAACAIAAVGAGTSSAATYHFAFVDAGANLDAYGAFTARNALDAKGGHDVTSIGGVVDGAAISALVANPNQPAADRITFPNRDYFSYDNVVYATAPHVDIKGILFKAGRTYYNIYNSDGVVGDSILSSFNGSNFVDATGTFGITQSPVPEAATWVLMVLGVGLAGTALRLNRGKRPGHGRRRMLRLSRPL